MNFILITLFVKLLLDYITGNNPMVSLQCGIWGFFGANSKKLSWDKFNILGTFNDPRGGDASGIVYGDNYSHNNKLGKLFINHSGNLKFPKLDGSTCAFGHTRKASFGKNMGIEYTQPLVNFKDDHITHMFSHNGTLHNQEDLIREFELEETFLYPDENNQFNEHPVNDSWVLLKAMIDRKFDILEKYIGGAAFSYYDKGNDSLYLWSGSSKHSENSNIDTEERPLYVAEGKDHIWFSSLKQPLDIIDTDDKLRIFSLLKNTLYVYKDGKLSSKTQYDRSKSYQTETYKYPSNKSSYSKSWPSGSKKNNLSLPMPQFCTSIIDTEKVESNEYDFMPSFARGRFWYKKQLLNGVKHISCFGEIKDSPITTGRDFEKTTIFYFFEGLMIGNHSDYRAICKAFSKKYKFSGAYAEDCKIAAKYSLYPVNVFGKDECFYLDNGEVIDFNGYYRPMFSKMEYIFSNNKCDQIIDSQLGVAFIDDGIEVYPDFVEEDDAVIDGVESEDTCIACNGTGISSKGGVCKGCNGTGKRVNPLESDLPFDNVDKDFDDYLSQQSEMIKKEVCDELAGVLQAAESAKSIIAFNSGEDFADSALETLDKIITKLELAGLPF